MKYTINEIQAKSILSPSGLPDTDWTINPYTGCRFGCKYCYAAFVGRFTHPDEEWGSYVDAKVNTPDLLKREIAGKSGTILFSSVTDPYQGLEAKYKLTRQCLQVLIDHNYQDKVGILTKSSLVTRDIDLFKQLPNLEVGLTVTSTGDPVARYLETFATPNEDRIKALTKLSDSDINTYAFVGPLLPHFVQKEKDLDKLFIQLKQSGVSYIYVEHINLTQNIKDRLFKFLKKDHPELLDPYKQVDDSDYRKTLDNLIQKLSQKHSLPLAHQKPLYHQEQS